MPSTYRASTVGDRVAIIHEMPDKTVVSELYLSQADILIEQLQAAKKTLLAHARRQAAIGIGTGF